MDTVLRSLTPMPHHILTRRFFNNPTDRIHKLQLRLLWLGWPEELFSLFFCLYYFITYCFFFVCNVLKYYYIIVLYVFYCIIILCRYTFRTIVWLIFFCHFQWKNLVVKSIIYMGGTSTIILDLKTWWNTLLEEGLFLFTKVVPYF